MLSQRHLSVIVDAFKRKGNELDAILNEARNNNAKSILVAWNRGLGDIALGLYAFVVRVKAFIPDAQITFMTRDELTEAFSLLEGTEVISVPWWERGKPVDVKKTIKDLDMQGRYDMIFEEINPTKWLTWQIGKLTPRLRWKEGYDNLWKRFNLDRSLSYIGAHIDTETQQFYRHKKDWPIEKWKGLLEMVCRNPDVNVLLFGLSKKYHFDNPSITDLRGETSLLEMISIIKNCCNVLIAPDGGVLSITYYIDAYFPITVISLWGDSNQGVMKQSVPSPNTGLKHIPVVGRKKDISKISVDDLYSILAVYTRENFCHNK